MNVVRGLIIALVCVVTSACAPDNPTSCERQQVGRTGEPLAPNETAAVPELVVANEPSVLRVFAPLTACVSDSPAAAVQLFDGDNLPVQLDAPVLINRAGLISAEVTFTPTTAGTYFMRATFEPNLGARSTTFLVVGPAKLDAGVRITLPVETSSCRDGVWPLGDDAVACETDGIDVFFADGGSRHFDGGGIATSGAVLWSVNAGALERRVYDGGTVSLSDAMTGVSDQPIAGMHGETFAIRRRADGLPTLFIFNGVLQSTESGTETGDAPFIYDSRRLMQMNGSVCGPLSAGCEVFVSPLAVEPTRLWTWDPLDQRFLRAWPFPFDLSPGAPTLFPGRPVAQARTRGPFERIPLWLERSTRGPGVDGVLVSFDDGALNISVWPRSRVLRVGSHVVVLQESDAFTVRLVPR